MQYPFAVRRHLPLLIAVLAGCGDSGAPAVGSDGGADAFVETGADAGPDGSDGSVVAPLPPGVNALLLPNQTAPLPLYRLAAPVGTTTAIAFAYDGTTLEAFDQRAASLWKKAVGPGAMFGGFDADGDGVVDVALVRATELPTACYGKPLHERTIDVVLGKDGTLFPKIVPPLSDICWNFGYATEQWSVLAALFGRGSRDLVLVPQYTSTNANALNTYDVGRAFVFGLEGGGFVKRGEMIMPTTPAYDALPLAQPEPHGSGTDYCAASHVPNGMVVGQGAATRLLFFTSGRAVQYDMTTPYALTADRPWLTAGRKDLVGRNYGLVMPDPAAPERVLLVNGATTHALFADMLSGTMTEDPYGGIERHVAVYDAKANTVDDRFFSYAHDGNDAFLYEGRLTHPNGAWVQSRAIFDVYQGGHWHTIVTTPGGTATAFDARDLFVWDVRDLDGDGELDVVATPSRDPSDPDVPGYYFVKWRTVLMRWDEPSKTLVPKRTIAGAIPWLVASFRDFERSSSGGFLYPALTVAQGSAPALVLRQSDGGRLVVTLP